MLFTKTIKNKIKYWIIFGLLAPLFFLWWTTNADLLEELIEPTYQSDTIIKLWNSVNQVWNRVIAWTKEVDKDWNTKKRSIILDVTTFLLSLVVTLSVTMILFNWIKYIVQTWQWKESKDLTKNIAYIVIWILVALFSVTIITIIQSIPATIDTEIAEMQ